MSETQLPPFITVMLNPAVYPHAAADIKLVQTHISYVFLAGDFVYKIKKPVDFGFLDFTSLQKRKYCCEQELVLNRRLSPSIYLGLAAITEQDGILSLDGPGKAIEYAVKMKRMPEEGMMSNIITTGRLAAPMIDAIIAKLVPFYEKASETSEIRQFGTANAVSVNVLENFDQTKDFVGCNALSQKQFDAISSYARKILARTDLFEKRIAAGRIRDCHGDLYSANICLADDVYIYDCIEFNQRFRYCDVASDVAFLAMDLDFHALKELSDYFINRFVTTSGDPGLLTMLNFYKCYRAYVRGKIGLFTAHATEVDETTREKSLAMAAKYLTLAERYAAAQ